MLGRVETPHRPTPVPDATSEVFWSAAAERRLVVQSCESCGRLSYPPEAFCKGCLSQPPAFAWHELSGRGRVRTWTVVRDAFLPGFADEVPYIVADVEMIEQPGLRIVAQMRGVTPEQMVIDMPVTVSFEDRESNFSLPVFVRGEV
jgi:uncharacterized OB-fold protein